MSSDASTQCSNSCANNGNIVVLKRAHSPEKNIIENESEYKGKKRKLNNGQRKPKEKVIKTDFEDFDFNETSYYIENNLRKVYPYYFTFKSHAKGRWVGKNILDVFKHEFRAHPLEEYKKSIQTGMLTVNNKTVEIDYVINNNDLISNKIHRHEVPVTTKAIEIVHLDDDLLVINKPASIPVHPCGRYRHNTIIFILAKEYNLKNLKTIHRLDRLTSGILLFGRSLEKSQVIEEQIKKRLLHKHYICRVQGVFPDEEIICEEPIEVISHKIGVCKVSSKGKDCKTTFRKLDCKNNESVVLCKPETGRMHQIRVHLQYLGFPIVNDPLYNSWAFGPLKGKGGDIGKSEEELMRDLLIAHSAETWHGETDSLLINEDKDINPQTTTANFDTNSISTQTNYTFPDSTFDPEKFSVDSDCAECKATYRDQIGRAHV